MKLWQRFTALRHRNYRLFAWGQGVSLIGTWMQSVAMSWLCYQLTGTAAFLGWVSMAGQLPTLLLAPLAGEYADRVDRRRILLLTQTLALAQALVLAALAWFQLLSPPVLLLASGFLGLVNAFDLTTRQAFLQEMVADRADLPNAIAINSMLVNGARLVGPSLAGLVLLVAQPAVCFLLNGLSYLAVLLAMGAMRLPARCRPPTARRVLTGVAEGLSYAWTMPTIRAALLLLALSSLFGMNFQVLLPVLTDRRLAGGPDTLGWLSTAIGLGALSAGAVLAVYNLAPALERWLPLAPATLGLGLLLISTVTSTALALLLLAGGGFAMMTQLATTNTLLQTRVAEHLRGRVLSLYSMALLGVGPLGSLLTGYLTDHFGLTATLQLSGAVCIAGAVMYAYAQRARCWEQAKPVARITPPLPMGSTCPASADLPSRQQS